MINKSAKPDISQATLKDLLIYVDGAFFWKIAPNGRVPVGKPCGNRNKDGYLRIQVERRIYMAHHLVWLWHHGTMPKLYIDHIDRNKANNRIENLREVSHAENMQNQGTTHKSNKSGFLGVSWCKKQKKWVAQIGVNKIKKYLGAFEEKELAHKAYLAEKQKLHPTFTAHV